ncbi:MAG TPA: YihY/virulence factor BrkB family protein [Candidatus Saccharimonadales bacterium]|jgi:YihY family inner membrane protein|nr:YihY/virulence factor BrkB family protein [Candidatus Saccharimonadales bacterium]
MKILDKLVHRLDKYQKHNRFLGFSVAVVKKYGDDEAGRQAALLTYYLFLSLFPLLLVLTTVTERVVGHNPHLENQVISGITNYFPALGTQLSAHVHSLHRSGLALIAGILFILYGARGVADVFKSGVRHIWGVPKTQGDAFPQSILKSTAAIVIGGLGLLMASVSAGLAASAGHGPGFRLLSILINAFILFWLFTFLINYSLPSHVKFKEIKMGAAVATIGLVMLQLIGNYILARELKHLDALYSTFAVALGLLFWIYLQAQVIYYAIEIAVVSSQKLWPRNLT